MILYFFDSEIFVSSRFNVHMIQKYFVHDFLKMHCSYNKNEIKYQ